MLYEFKDNIYSWLNMQPQIIHEAYYQESEIPEPKLINKTIQITKPIT